jgi:sec-independent protein translocase protein TatB
MPDILFILVLALVIFGPKKLPEVMRQVAKFMAQFRMMSDDLKRQILSEIVKIELDEREKQKAAAPQVPPAEAPTSSPSILPPPPALDGNVPAAG